jgi:hypothetical protein
MLTFILFKKAGLLYGTILAGAEAGAARAASKFLPSAGAGAA